MWNLNHRSFDVIVKHEYNAAPEIVFEAWLDPARARRFFFATPKGQMAPAELNPRVNGKFVFVDRRDGVDVEHVGEYLKIDRPRRLVFKFSTPQYSANVDRLIVEIAPVNNG